MNPFSNRSPIGLDIGERYVGAVQLRQARSGTRVCAAARIARAQSESPFDTDECARILGALSRQGFVGRSIVLGVPKTRLLTGVFELPPRSSGAPLDQIARAELSRHHRCTPQEIEIGWWELPSGTRAVEQTQAMAVACRHADADSLLATFEGHGASIASIDAMPLALARACSPWLASSADNQAGRSSITALLDLGFSGALVAVLHGRTLVYERVLPQAGLGALRQKISAELKVDADVADFAIERVGISQPTRGLPSEAALSSQSHAPLGLDSDLVEEIGRLIVEYAQSVCGEVQASLTYAARRYASPGAPAVIIGGGGASIAGLPERLESQLEMSVRIATPAALSGLADESDESLAASAASPALTPALGLALYTPNSDEQEDA